MGNDKNPNKAKYNGFRGIDFQMSARNALISI